VTTLYALQKSVCSALREAEYLRVHGICVLAEDEGNVLFDREAAFTRTHLAVSVGAADFTPSSRSAHTPEIAGMARLAVRVWEEPSRNRVGQSRAGPAAAEVVEAVACTVHLLQCCGGTLVFTGIGGVLRHDDTTIVREAGFEIFTKLAI